MWRASHCAINCCTKQAAFFLSCFGNVIEGSCMQLSLSLAELVPFSSEIWRAFCVSSLRLDYLNCTWDFVVLSPRLWLPHLSLQGGALQLKYKPLYGNRYVFQDPFLKSLYSANSRSVYGPSHFAPTIFSAACQFSRVERRIKFLPGLGARISLAREKKRLLWSRSVL